MKILIITSKLNTTDGWGRLSRDFSEGLSTQDNEVLVVVSESVLESVLNQKEVLLSPEKYLANPLQSFISARKIQKIINSFKPDVIQFFVEPYITIVPFLSIQPNMKVVVTVQGTYSFMPVLFKKGSINFLLSKWLTKKSYNKLTSIIAASSYTKDYFLNNYKQLYKNDFDSNKITIITNGINLKAFSSLSKQEVEKSKNKSIVFVGAVKRRKGVLEAINALEIYSKVYGSDFTYTIVGPYKQNDAYVQLLKRNIKNSGLEHQVVWAGLASDKDLRQIYNNANLYLMLSIQDGAMFEGFGIVYLEANAYGVPTIGSRASGAVDAIKDGFSGYLVDAFNSKEVSEKIHEVLDNKLIQSDNCITWAHEHSIEKKVDVLLYHYKNI